MTESRQFSDVEGRSARSRGGEAHGGRRGGALRIVRGVWRERAPLTRAGLFGSCRPEWDINIITQTCSTATALNTNGFNLKSVWSFTAPRRASAASHRYERTQGPGGPEATAPCGAGKEGGAGKGGRRMGDDTRGPPPPHPYRRDLKTRQESEESSGASARNHLQTSTFK